jgi:hypothetical protein
LTGTAEPAALRLSDPLLRLSAEPLLRLSAEPARCVALSLRLSAALAEPAARLRLSAPEAATLRSTAEPAALRLLSLPRLRSKPALSRLLSEAAALLSAGLLLSEPALRGAALAEAATALRLLSETAWLSAGRSASEAATLRGAPREPLLSAHRLTALRRGAGNVVGSVGVLIVREVVLFAVFFGLPNSSLDLIRHIDCRA